MVSKRYFQGPIPGTYDLHLIKKKRLLRRLLSILSLRDYPGLFRWAVNTMGKCAYKKPTEEKRRRKQRGHGSDLNWSGCGY